MSDETEIVTPESKEDAEKELPPNCRKCRFFKHANNFLCYNPPPESRAEARVVANPSDGRMDWCQLEKEVKDE